METPSQRNNTPPSTIHFTGVGRDGSYTRSTTTSLTKANAIWIYIIGFFTGIFATMIVTILIGWIVNAAFPHSSWLNKGFYGYALGCSSIADKPDTDANA